MTHPRKGKHYPNPAQMDAVENCIRAYRLRNRGVSPSLRDIVRDAALSGVSMAHYYIDMLIQDGRVGKVDGAISRAVFLVDGSDIPKRKSK